MSSTPATTTVSIVSQPVDNAAFDALSISAITSTSPFGFASKADADALIARVEAIVAGLKSLGLFV